MDDVKQMLEELDALLRAFHDTEGTEENIFLTRVAIAELFAERLARNNWSAPEYAELLRGAQP